MVFFSILKNKQNITLFLLFAYLTQFVVFSTKLHDQYQASCFPGCRCNKTVIECRDLGETTTELFRHVNPTVYPELDTLIVTGNNFGDLPNENIFGENIRHSKLSLVNISNNGIQSFGSQTFIGIPRVEYFYLDNNAINQVVDDQPFNYLTSLKLLSMNHIFGDHISVQARADFVWHILHNNHSFNDLYEIILTNNRIDHLRNDTFCNINGLTQLRLANNELKNFELKAGCLSSLHMLDLASNLITTILPSFWNNFQSLDTTDFSRNPLVCDCKLEPFHKLALQEVNTFLNQEFTTCAKPPKLAGKNFFKIDTDVNLCENNSSNGTSFGHWLLIILIGIGIVLGYRFFNGSELFKKLYNDCCNSEIRLPLISEGYSKLRSHDEVPVFV